MRRGPCAVVLCAGLWLASSAASGQPTLVRGDVDGAGLEGVLHGARSCGSAAPRVTTPSRPAAPQAAAEVTEAVSRARLLTLDAEFERAITELQRLYVELAREPERAGTGQVWAEALTIDAFARWSRAGGPEAVPSDVASRLDEAVGLWPEVQVDHQVVPPAVQRALEAARDRRARRTAGEIAIADGRVATWAWVSGAPETDRVVLRPAGRTIVALIDAWGRKRARLVDVRPGGRAEVAFVTGRRPSDVEPPPGVRRPIVIGVGPEGAVAQRWGEGQARVDVTRSASALARRLGLCGGSGTVEDEPEGDDPADGGGASGGGGGGGRAVLFIVGAAVVVAGGVALTFALTDEPDAEIRMHLGQ